MLEFDIIKCGKISVEKLERSYKTKNDVNNKRFVEKFKSTFKNQNVKLYIYILTK